MPRARWSGVYGRYLLPLVVTLLELLRDELEHRETTGQALPEEAELIGRYDVMVGELLKMHLIYQTAPVHEPLAALLPAMVACLRQPERAIALARRPMPPGWKGRQQ